MKNIKVTWLEINKVLFGKDVFRPYLKLVEMQVRMGRKVKPPKHISRYMDDDEAMLSAFKKHFENVDKKELTKSFLKQVIYDNKGGKDFRCLTKWTSAPIVHHWCHREHKLVIHVNTKLKYWCKENIETSALIV